MSPDQVIARLIDDASNIPLGNITDDARWDERAGQAYAIRDAIGAGIAEERVFVRLHDGQAGWPSIKVRDLLAA